MLEDKLRVLLIDDDEGDRLEIRRSLLAAGVNVDIDEESRPAESPARARQHLYDCLVLAHRIRSEDGQPLVTQLRAAGVTAPILVVAVGDEEAAAQLVAVGASDYLPRSDLSSPTRLVCRLRNAIRVGQAVESARTALVQLAGERQLLLAILRQMPAAVIIASVPAGEVLLANDQVAELLGQPVALRTAITQLERYDAYRPDDTRYAVQEWPLARAVNQGETVAAEEIHCRHPDGRRVLIRASAAPVYDAEGRVAVAVMTMDDLTNERQAQQALEQAARAREEILAIVSHDLRNPLNAISVSLDEIVEPTLDADTRTQYVSSVRHAVWRANRLIRDLLDASLIEAGQLSIEPRAMSVAGLLKTALHNCEVQAGDAGMQLRIDVEAAVEAVQVQADRDRLLQVLENLIGNALRHARGCGEILLSAQLADEFVRVGVADRGPGIPPGALPYLFDRYWQAHRQRRAGAGLGLAIAKGIVEQHGGRITAGNRDGGGAQFWFTLPIATRDAAG